MAVREKKMEKAYKTCLDSLSMDIKNTWFLCLIGQTKLI